MKTSTEENKYLSVTSYAKKTGKSRMTIYRWIEEGKIQTCKIDGRLYVVAE